MKQKYFGKIRLAVGFTVLIHVNGALGLFDDFGGLGQIFRPRDFEESAALFAPDPLIGGAAIQQPHSMTSRTCGPNLHQPIS